MCPQGSAVATEKFRTRDRPYRLRGFEGDAPRVLAYGARSVVRNFSTSSLRRLLSPDIDCAEDSICAEAEPVSEAPRLTSEMFAATRAVPLAASPTLREISPVAAPCSSTAAAIAAAMSDIRAM